MRFTEEDCETTTNMSFSKNIGMTKNARKRMSNVQENISFKKRIIQGKRTRLYLFQENIEIIQVYIYIYHCVCFEAHRALNYKVTTEGTTL